MYSKNDYLDRMGIQRWHKRPASVNYIAWILRHVQTGQNQAILYLEVNADAHPNAEEDNLLTAMLAAIDLRRDTEASSCSDRPNTPVLVMGERLAQWWRQALKTHSPAALLANPALKRAAWEDLKRFKQMLTPVNSSHDTQ